jgi:hypothetical protein
VILNKASDTDNLEFSPPSTVPDQGNLVTVDNLTHTRVDLSFGGLALADIRLALKSD